MISVVEFCAQTENESCGENIRVGLAHRAANSTYGLYTRELYGYKKKQRR